MKITGILTERRFAPEGRKHSVELRVVTNEGDEFFIQAGGRAAKEMASRKIMEGDSVTAICRHSTSEHKGRLYNNINLDSIKAI